MEISDYAILIWITAILIISLDIVILAGSKNFSSRIFALLSFLTAVWVISHGFLISITNGYTADWLIRVQYILGITITIGFYLFSIVYPEKTVIHKKYILGAVSVILVFCGLLIFTDLINSGANYIGGTGKWSWGIGPYHIIYVMVFWVIWIVSLKKLYTTYKTIGNEHKINSKIMFWGLFLGIIPPSFANILLPSIGIFQYNWIGPLTSAIWIFIIGYSIARYHQMNVKVVITEVLAVALTVIFFINIFVNVPSDLWTTLPTFIVFIILAYYLILASVNESHQKDLLQSLNTNLNQIVSSQTAEIRHSYDLEKKARRELEKLNETKDQFIMITQHHLRTPVTGLKWELEQILGGAYGKMNDEMKKGIMDAQSAVARLGRIVDDFLDITSLKVGDKILNVAAANMKPLVDDVLKELRIDIENKELEVNIPDDPRLWPDIQMDAGKVREALLIIIENAVRYNIAKGNISFHPRIAGGSFELAISNTGIGITPMDRAKIFGNLFYRGERARRAHPIGMGIGLSVAKAVIRAHHGEFSIESEGEGRGAKVEIVLPLTSRFM